MRKLNLTVTKIIVSNYQVPSLVEAYLWGGIHSIQDWTATTRHGVTGKSNTKRLKHTGNLFRKSPHLIGVC